jgi:hypothetical protein
MSHENMLDVQDQAGDTRPSVLPDGDHLNWDVCIERPPARPGGALTVQLRYEGRSKPLPVPDPSEE